MCALIDCGSKELCTYIIYHMVGNFHRLVGRGHFVVLWNVKTGYIMGLICLNFH